MGGTIKKVEGIWDDPNLPSDKATAINRSRMETYGSPVPVFRLTADLWSAFLGVPVTDADVAELMVLHKIAREKNAGYLLDYADNNEDVCGYTNCLHIIKEARRGSESATG